ncbi:hypothetical protein CCZ20_22240 [Priestia aryabhattai]|uniref:hypothetical protein n=1 Tax=Priestia aryabhattai TaxID=412384 RepID=UPI000B4FD7CF|nr:hypothetical protein [Priestia aryabhattai]MBZ6486428.1 hypothetical protein [Priestia aryabhattai]MDH3132080.1 hypothetical protein [Priestia aryabhattai]OVE35136.1 hypothetical protein CCZ20_22240 [Priestia aryabhattai]
MERNFVVTLSICVLSILLKVILIVLNSNGIYVQSTNFSQEIINLTINIVILLSITRIIMYKLKDKTFKTLTVICAPFLIVSNFCWWLMIDSDATYTTCYSPNRNEAFVVKETRHSEVYQLLKFKLLSKKLVDIRGDDGYRMFYEDSYKLEWMNQNKLKIHYLFDPISPNDYKDVTVTYKEY